MSRAGGPEWFGEGQGCEVPCGTLHAEHYGPAGCTVLVGRRRD